MDQKLKGFFNTAKQTADEISAARTAAADAEAQRKRKQAENQQLLNAQVAEELGPILDVLKNLPPKDGKGFSVSARDSTFTSSSTEAEYDITVSYKAIPRPSNHSYGHSHEYDDGEDRWQPTTSIRVSRDGNGALSFRCTQYAIIERSGDDYHSHHKFTRPNDFEAARQELALGLGTFAADRMDEIGAALGALPDAPAAPVVPVDPDKIEVFRKPISLKGSNADAPRAEPPVPPPAPAPAPSPVLATGVTKAPLWKRALGMG